MFWRSDPRGYEVAKWVVADLCAEIVIRDKARREGRDVRKPANDPLEQAKLIDAAVQRLMSEAKRLPEANPNTRSPAWIGRDLEVEGWDRKLLTKALAQAIEDGDLVIEEVRDGKRNLKRTVRPAPTGVAVKIFG
jgi:hypothetical protein